MFLAYSGVPRMSERTSFATQHLIIIIIYLLERVPTGRAAYGSKLVITSTYLHTSKTFFH